MKPINSYKQKLASSAYITSRQKAQISTPISLIHEEMKYFSPFIKSTQKQIIDEIKSLGQEILEFDETVQKKEQSHKSKTNLHNLNASLDNKITERHTPITMTNQIIKKKPKYGIIEESMTRSLTHSRQRQDMTEREEWEQLKKKNTNLSSRRQPTQPVPVNMYDKYKNQMRAKRNKKIENKTSELYSDLEQFQSSRNNSKQKLKDVKSRHIQKQAELNYTKYINRNVQKLIKQERQWVTAKTSSTLGSQVDKNSSFHIKKQRQIPNKQTVKKSFENVFKKSQQIIERKSTTAHHLRQEQYKKDMKEATFKPKLHSFNTYKPKNGLIKSKPDPKNFAQRQKVYQIDRTSKQKDIIRDMMEGSTFQPKINIQTSKHTESITKSIWSSQHASTASIIHNRSIDKFKESTFRTQNSQDDTQGGISIRNAEEMKFLFN